MDRDRNKLESRTVAEQKAQREVNEAMVRASRNGEVLIVQLIFDCETFVSRCKTRKIQTRLH